LLLSKFTVPNLTQNLQPTKKNELGSSAVTSQQRNQLDDYFRKAGDQNSTMAVEETSSVSYPINNYLIRFGICFKTNYGGRSKLKMTCSEMYR
jgi:hypothetical protein